MTEKATVSEKGQVTIPKRLRDRLGIRPGQVLDFHEEHGTLIATKRSAHDPVAAVFGVIPHGCSTDETVEGLRGPPDTV